MRFFSILFLIIPLTLTAYAQETITISGMVMNKETNVAIPWASIGIEGQPIGTLSGDNGAFEFHFHSKYLNDTLVVSHVGFSHLRISVKDILRLNTKHFLIAEEPFQLSEVVIRAKELSAKEIMKKAFERIEANYANQPYLADAFYRDYKKVNGQYTSLLEAATKIYDEGYSTKNKEIVTIDEIRRSKRFINEYESFVSSWNLLQKLLETNDVKYKSRSLNIQSNKYEIESTILFDKKPVYVITTGSYRRFKLYVSQADFGILRIEYA
ncbi:MAG TPA: carboxypeptidase-like regulatory domain-containing protein, partial [Nitrososphaeraceae archaeon]